MEKDLIVYKISFIDTDKCYIGITNNFEIRKKKHMQNAKTGVEGKLYDAIRKYKNPIFDVLEVCSSIETLLESEIKYIREYDSFRYGLNMTLGGEGSFGSKRPKSKKWRKEHSKKMMGENNPMFGKKLSEERKKEHSKKMKEYYENNPQKKAWGNKSSKDFIWITNGIECKKIKKTDDIPKGFIKGRTNYQQKYLQRIESKT